MDTDHDDRGFFPALLGDGRPPLAVLGLGLILAGLFALFLSITGEYLPHDEQFLGMSAHELCAVHGCRIVHFMIHDRASFGGALVAVGLIYLWLVAFPLRQGRPWAWRLLLVSGLEGFASFFVYLGYGYLDRWHAVASFGLLLCYAVGLTKARALVPAVGARCLLQSVPWPAAARFGRLCLLAAAVGKVGAGLVIMTVGMTSVFVPEDLKYMGVSVEELNALNPRLVPLIAHDRAGFGGVVCCYGLCMAACVWCGQPVRSLWQMLALAGLIGYATAIGVHPAVGYNDPFHLAPAVVGAVAYGAGLWLTYRPLCRPTDVGAALLGP